MNNEEENATKPTTVVGDLADGQELLDDSSSTDEVELENIPLLDESIPELNEIVENIPNIKVSLDIKNSTDTIEQAINPIDAKELILANAWQKVEALLMDNLPAQLSGAFLELLNTRINENKQQLIEQLSLLDEDVVIELLDTLDIEQGF